MKRLYRRLGRTGSRFEKANSFDEADPLMTTHDEADPITALTA